MKLAILGLGTSGAIAARMLKRRFPNSSITIIHSPTIPAIGVGEGAGPWFKRWLDEEGITAEAMANEANATKKKGICFENWGEHAKRHSHSFTPVGGAFSYHFDANKITQLLLKGIHFNVIEKTASEWMSQDQRMVSLEIEDIGKENFDYVIDCRGFKRKKDKERTQKIKPLIANTACIQKCQAKTNESKSANAMKTTKAITRPFGWIFHIPLKNKISIGYVYNSELSNQKEIDQDLDQFLKERKLIANNKRRIIQFESHLGEKHLEGRIYRLGNRAGFIEPLEATSIEMTIHHCKLITAHIKHREQSQPKNSDLRRNEQRFNFIIRSNMEKIALFVSWHYSNGSIYDTAYWRKAKDNHDQMIKKLISKETTREFLAWCSKEHKEKDSSEPSQGKNQMFFAWNSHSFNAIRDSIA